MLRFESFLMVFVFLVCVVARDAHDSVTVTTHQSASAVIKDAFNDALLGIFLIVVTFPFLFYNELRHVRMSAIFHYAEQVIVDVSADEVNPSNEGCPVCVSGETSTKEKLSDPKLRVEVSSCAKLSREVEMYQWKESCHTETKDNANGSKTTEKKYTYHKDWAPYHINSNAFQMPDHKNPAMPLKNEEWVANKVSLGDFKLDSSLVGQMVNYVPAAIAEQKIGGTSLKRKSSSVIESGGGTPDIGDLRVKMRKVTCGQASVAAIQSGSSFQPLTYQLVPSSRCCCGPPRKVNLSKVRDEPEIKGLWSCCGWLFKLGESLHHLEERKTTGKQIIENARGRQGWLHLGIKILGWFLFYGGFYNIFVFGPAVFRYMYFIGTWMEYFGQWVAVFGAFSLATFMWSITIAISWLTVKPVRGLCFLVLGVAVIILPTICAGYDFTTHNFKAAI